MRAQRGVALLAALLIVAIATVLLASILDRGEAVRGRSRHLLRAEQSWQLLRGVEMWAQGVLRRDHDASRGFDARGEGWSQPMPPISVPGGQLSGVLSDASGCFNLNNLARAGAADEVQIKRLGNLLTALQLNPDLANAVADWIDADSAPRSPGGAEDLDYLAGQQPHRAANAPLSHRSELRLIAGIDAEAYQRLAPHVCAWPAPSDINLNFASVPVWQSIDERITEALARRLWRDGQAQFRDTDAIVAELQPVLGPQYQLPAGYSTRTRWFVLRAELLADGLPFVYSSVIERNETQVETVARIRGRW